MLFKKITSTLLLMTILLQSVLPSFAMEEDRPVLAGTKAKKSSSHAIYKSSESIQFPDTLEELTYVEHIEGGSGGVSVLKTREGDLFTLKSMGDPQHMKEEILADALLQALGVNVPPFAVYDDFPALSTIKGGPGLYRLARFIVKSENASEEDVRAQMQRFFVANAFLSNFDIVVGGFKNIIFDRAGTLWQVDNGGSLRFRATGGSKFDLEGEKWDPDHVRELETMRDPHYNPDGAKIYEGLQEEAIMDQIKEVLALSPQLLSTLDHIASALHLDNPSEIREMLRRRLDDLSQRYMAKKILEIQGENHFLDGFIAPSFASGIFVYSRNPQNELVVLLGKRKRHNWWCNPGGGIDPGETPEEGAVRETQEESLGHLSFTPLDLSHMSSHSIVNRSSVFYRMYIAPHPFKEAEKFMSSSLADKYGWEQEYTEYRWVSLDAFLKGLKEEKIVIEENTKTCQIENMSLYPPFWEMLQELEVKNILQKILEKGDKAVSHPYNRHTHNKALERIFSDRIYLPLQNEERALAETVVRKGNVLAELKSRWAQETDDQEVSETIKSISGYLSDEETAAFKTKLLACPYTQTEAYLKWIMKEDFDPREDTQHQIETFLRTYAKLRTIQTPPSLFDQHYIKVLTQALETEKKHSERAVFYHASDPMTCFLWNIFTAYRSRLQLRGGEESNLVLRALDDKFASILDVEAFIKNYQSETGAVSNYATVGNIHYADLGLSVNPGIPGSDGHSTSSTYYHFYKTTSVSPVQQEALFNYFMSTLGIPGEFKNYEALFNQYYTEDFQANAFLLQIFIDPQILGCVSYMAVAGGGVLTLGGTSHPDHRFGSYLTEIRTNPIAFSEQTIGDLNRLQGRLFLKPEIFHNPKFVKIQSYWHHPMKSEDHYWDKLNRQITQDLTEWLAYHTCLPHDVFFDEQCSLKKMYRYVYEGQLQLSYREKSFKFFLSNAIRSGNMPLIHQIFETHPEIDLNEGFPSLDYRSHLTPSIVSPFNLLSPDTPNFSEIVQFLVKKKAKRPHFDLSINNLEDKIVNEFVGVLDHLSLDLLTWTTASLERKFNFSRTLIEYEERHLLENLVDCHQKYKHMFSFMRDKIEKFLRTNFLEEEKKITKIAEEEGRASTGLTLSPKMMTMIETFLVLRDDLNIPEFTSLWNHIILFPNDYIQKFQNANKDKLVLSLLRATKATMINLYDAYHLTDNEENSNSLIEALASNTNLKALQISDFDPFTRFLKNLLTDPRFAALETFYVEKESLSPVTLGIMVAGLKENTTLKELKLSDDQMADTMRALVSSPQGPFTNAPWFVKSLRADFLEEEKVIKTADEGGTSTGLTLSPKMINMIEALLTLRGSINIPEFTSLWEHIVASPNDYIQKFQRANKNKLVLSLLRATKVKMINLTDTYRLTNTEESSNNLIEALASNANLKTLQISGFDPSTRFLKNLLTDPRLAALETFYFEREFFGQDTLETMIEGLKGNATLKGLKVSDDRMTDIMINLMSSQQGPFTNAPWFIKAKTQVLQNPEKYIKGAIKRENYLFILDFLKSASYPIKISTFFKSSFSRGFLNKLIESIYQNTAPSHLDLSDMSLEELRDTSLSLRLTFREALATNSTLQFLDLSNCFHDRGKVKNLSEALQKNNTLQKLSLNEEDMTSLMTEMMKMVGPFREAPWFIHAWKEIILSPIKNIKIAAKHENDELIFPIIAETDLHTLDLSEISTATWGVKWIHFAMKGLIQNKTTQALSLNLDDFYKANDMDHLAEALHYNKTLVSLTLKGESRLSPETEASFISALCQSTSLTELVLDQSLTDNLKFQILERMSANQGKLPKSLKIWFTSVKSQLLKDRMHNLQICLKNNFENLTSFLLETMTELTWQCDPISQRNLFNAFEMNTTISVLDLDFSTYMACYYSSPLDSLIPFLEKTSIQTIILRDYYFSLSHAQQLTETCLKNSSLKTLDLSQCFLRNQVLDSKQETRQVFDTAEKEAFGLGKIFLIPAVGGE